MKRCSRCGCQTTTLIRDSLVMRRGALCRLLWYRCPDCQDVGFAMKPASDAVNSVVETTVGEIRTVAVKV